MDGLARIKGTLAALTGADLRAIMLATYRAPQTAPGLLTWIDTACDWELGRRRGDQFHLQAPHAAIPDDEDLFSVDAAMALRKVFAKNSPTVRALFDELVMVLTGAGRRQ